MTNKEKKLIKELDGFLAIPRPSGGTQSSSLRGVIGYNADMEKALPIIRDTLRQLWQGEDWENCIEENLEKLRAWWKERAEADWQ